MLRTQMLRITTQHLTLNTPQSGSFMLICYISIPGKKVIEVNSLHKFIRHFAGGFDQIRDMEGAVQYTASFWAAHLDASVIVGAHIILHNHDSRTIYAIGNPATS